MKLPKLSIYFTDNPIGLVLVLLHWGIFLFLISPVFFDLRINFFAKDGLGFIFLTILFAIDLPAIIPICFLLSPIALIGAFEIYFLLVAFFSIFTITFQWLVIGKKIKETFVEDNADEDMLSIIDSF